MEQKTTQPDFWSDNEKAQAILKQTASLKKEQERFRSLEAQLQELSSLAELAQEDDQAFQNRLLKLLEEIKQLAESRGLTTYSEMGEK